MATTECERKITYDEIYEYTRKIRIMPRKGYSIKGSCARANETIEINRLELVAVLQKCGFVAHGYESYAKRFQRACHLEFASVYKEDAKLYNVRNYTRKSQYAKSQQTEQ